MNISVNIPERTFTAILTICVTCRAYLQFMRLCNRCTRKDNETAFLDAQRSCPMRVSDKNVYEEC